MLYIQLQIYVCNAILLYIIMSIIKTQQQENKTSNNPNSTLLTKIEKLEKRSNKTFTNLQHILDQTMSAIQATQMEIQQPDKSVEDALNGLHNKLTEIKPLSNLRGEFNNLYKGLSGVNKYIEEIHPAVDPQLLRIQPIFDKEQSRLIENSLADHYLRQQKYQFAKIFSSQLYDEKKDLYLECFKLKKEILALNFDGAIEWTEKTKLLGNEQIVGYELKKAKIINLAKTSRGQQAIEYYKISMGNYSNIRMQEITLLMGYILGYAKQFWSKRQEFTQALLHRFSHFQNYDVKGLANTFEQTFYKMNSLNLQNPIIKCHMIGTKYLNEAVAQITKLPKTQQIPKTLPISVHLEDSQKYHSQFFCPINKEFYNPDENCVILKCGHMLSYMALDKIIESRNSRRKLKCPICQKQNQADQYTEVHF